MTECDLDTAVPEWVTDHPETLDTFRALGIDTSCGGKSLGYACRQRGLDGEAVLTELRRRLGAGRRGGLGASSSDTSPGAEPVRQDHDHA